MTDESLVLDVGGVGYLLFCTAETLHAHANLGEPLELSVRTQVRDDDISLYGFVNPSQRDWFVTLQSVQGVGARLALSILSTLSVDHLDAAVLSGDKGALTRVSGVGPRLATRILSELQSRRPQGKITGFPVHQTSTNGPKHSAKDDALSALVNLGYGRSEAFLAVNKAMESDGSGSSAVEDIIKQALKELTR